MQRLGRLDHLRACAAIIVGFWHFNSLHGKQISNPYNILSIFAQGWTGVSMFCVISGFILTIIYLNRDTSYGSFVRNRLLRVAPLFVLIVYAAFYTTGWDAQAILVSAFTGMFRGGFPSFAGPLWTVVIEMQFYVLFPFLLMFSRRYGVLYLVGLALFFMIFRASMWSEFGSVEQLAYYTIFGRIDQFIVGMIAAHLVIRPGLAAFFARPAVAIAMFAAGLMIAISFFGWFNQAGGLLNFLGHPFPSPHPIWILIPMGEALTYALIIIGYLNLPALPGTTIPSRVFAYIGLVSYSIYLDQMLVFNAIMLLRSHFDPYLVTWINVFTFYMLVALPCLVAAASMTYFLVERPFMQMRSGRRGAAMPEAANSIG